MGSGLNSATLMDVPKVHPERDNPPVMTPARPGRPGPSWLLAAGLAAASVGLPAALAPAPRAPSVVATTESGIWGGGLLNTIAADPNNPSRFMVGGDVSGFHTSTDDGVTWVTSNRGLNDPQQDTVVSVLYRQLDPPGRKDVFAAFGAAGGGMLFSPNGGGRWLPFGAGASEGGPAFEGHDPCGIGPYPDPCTDPRPTGNLIILDEAGGQPPTVRFVYVGTFGRGLMRTDGTGSSWTTIALGSGTTYCSWGDPPKPGCYVTSLVRDPRRRNVLYVGTHGNGIFKVAGTDCVGDGCAEPNVTPIEAAPGSDPIVDAEELWFQEESDGTHLMCACGRQGFYQGTFPLTSLTQSNAGLAFDTTPGHETSYTAVSGNPDDPGSALYLANVNSLCEVPEGGRNLECHTVYHSLDGGSTWEDVAFDQDVQKTVAGTDLDWWDFLCCRDNMLNQESYGATAIALTADVPPAVLVAGRSGVWKTTSDGDTHWQPAVQGLGTTIDDDAITDPKALSRAYVSALDWTSFASSSNLSAGTAVQSEPNKTFTNGYALAVDTQTADATSPVYLAAGSNDIAAGGVYTSTDPTNPGGHPWVSLGFTVTDCDRTTPRVIGVGVGRVSVSAAPLVFAATDGCGLWRYDGTRWQNVGLGTDMFSVEDPGIRFAPISYPNDLGRLLFAFDRVGGTLWESSEQGSPGSWEAVWHVPSGETVDAHTGFMVADPNARGTVWVTTDAVDGLHELSCPIPPVADGCTDLMVPPPNVRNPGPIAIRPCLDACTSTLYVATRTVTDDSTLPALYKHTSGNTSWCNLTSGAAPLYTRAATSPNQLAASAEDAGLTRLYLGTTGNGVLVVSDDTVDCAP
jgi:hypothetical protein